MVENSLDIARRPWQMKVLNQRNQKKGVRKKRKKMISQIKKQYKTIREQAQLGVQHSNIQVELD